jgi:hypothetical protein
MGKWQCVGKGRVLALGEMGRPGELAVGECFVVRRAMIGRCGPTGMLASEIASGASGSSCELTPTGNKFWAEVRKVRRHY